MKELAGKTFVLAPDLIGASLIDPVVRRILEQWRDDAFKVVMNRQLLVRHVKVLSALGLRPELIHRWTLWFTSPIKSNYLPDLELPDSSIRELCEGLAAATKAPILCWRIPVGANSPAWIKAAGN